MMTRATATPVPAHDQNPLDLVGRVFVNQDTGTDLHLITVAAWWFASGNVAAQSLKGIEQQAMEPHPMSRASVVDIETFPLSSLPGSLTSWAEASRSGAEKKQYAGGFFQREELCWSMETIGDDRDAMFELITHVAQDLLSREVPASLDTSHSFEGGLWDLLPQVQDLPGTFTLRQFFQMETTYNPEGTPYPPEEAVRQNGSSPHGRQ